MDSGIDPEERDMVIDRAAREINDMGEMAVDTFMSCERLSISPDEVAEVVARLIGEEEESE